MLLVFCLYPSISLKMLWHAALFLRRQKHLLKFKRTINEKMETKFMKLNIHIKVHNKILHSMVIPYLKSKLIFWYHYLNFFIQIKFGAHKHCLEVVILLWLSYHNNYVCRLYLNRLCVEVDTHHKRNNLDHL